MGLFTENPEPRSHADYPQNSKKAPDDELQSTAAVLSDSNFFKKRKRGRKDTERKSEKTEKAFRRF